MKNVFCAFFIFFLVCPQIAGEEYGMWDEEETSVQEEPLYRQVRYETHSRPSGWMSHKWSLDYVCQGKKLGIFFAKSQSAESSLSQALGFRGRRNYKRIGFQAGYAQSEWPQFQAKGKSYLWGSLRLSPIAGLDLLAHYGQTQRTFALPRDEDDLGSFSAGFHLRVERSLSVRVLHAPERRTNVEVAYRW